jgi:hypothetical protein
MQPTEPPDEDFGFLLTHLERGKKLRFFVIECSWRAVLAGLRDRLGHYCDEHGRPFRSPPAPEATLDWLANEQAAGARRAAPERASRPQPVLFLPIPESLPEETFIFRRLNENRDNLRRDLTGALCLVGLPGIMGRMQQEAPDLWSVRARTFEFTRLHSYEEDCRFDNAADARARTACDNLYDLYRSGALGRSPQDEARAVAFCERACTAHDARGCAELGEYMARMDPADRTVGVQILREACKGDVRIACSELERLHDQP